MLLAVLGQGPPPPTHQTVQQIRAQLNRFDDLDRAALEAKAKVFASACAGEENLVRRRLIQGKLRAWALVTFDHVQAPLQDAEESLIENVADDVAKPYDRADNPLPTPARLVSVPSGMQEKAWHEVNVNGSVLRVWGFVSPTGNIRWAPREQPLAVWQAYVNATTPTSIQEPEPAPVPITQVIQPQPVYVQQAQPVPMQGMPLASPFMGLPMGSACVGGSCSGGRCGR